MITDNNMTVLFLTLGCKVNQYDSGSLLNLLCSRGFLPYAADDTARGPDAMIVNTCIVSSESERKSRQAIRRMRARYPQALLVVVGCYPQRFPKQAASIDGVDMIAGTSGHPALADDIVARLNANKSGLGGRRADDKFNYKPDRTRAYIKIQDGCDSFCSYCIVPYTRGRAASRELPLIMQEIDAVVLKGAPEIVLTGIHISSYRYEYEQVIPACGGKPEVSAAGLGDLVCLAAERMKSAAAKRKGPLVSGVGESEPDVAYNTSQNHECPRIRLSSIEPTIITSDFVKRLAEIRDILCPHFHLPLQSGCASTLMRMNRHYTPDDYYAAVSLLRREFPEAGITTDVIAGFPGESESDFMETYNFCRRTAFSGMHIFPYSVRPGTPAADFTDPVPQADRRERVRRLIALSGELSMAFHRRHIGKAVPFLIEDVTGGFAEGLTGNYIKVHAKISCADASASSGASGGAGGDVSREPGRDTSRGSDAVASGSRAGSPAAPKTAKRGSYASVLVTDATPTHILGNLLE
ncbi:MAG: radical SAM protein [Oscillospiraceae bacterium]|nr:radical SAM protein [Oscillospiraceae bacterium]